MALVEKTDQFLRKITAPSLFFIVAFFEIIIAWADFHTDYRISFKAFYILPIFLASWYGPRELAFGITLISAAIGSIDFYRTHLSAMPMWLILYNLAEEGLLFSFFLLLIFKIKGQYVRSFQEKEALLRANSFLNATLESTTDGILVVDKTGSLIYLYNDRFLSLWHVPLDVLQKIKENRDDHPLLTYVTSQLKDPVSFFEKVKDLYNHPDAESFDTLELADGRIFERYSRPQLLEGKAFGRVWSFRDVTEKKRAETELLKSMKLESIGLLASGIAHDFNNILTAILGNVSLAKLEIDADHTASACLNETERAVLSARDLANQLLTFAKGGSPQKRFVSLPPLLKEAITFALRGSHIQPKFIFSDNLWKVNIDPGQITQLAHNLVINSKQATEGEGTIVIQAENVLINEPTARKLSVEPGFYLMVAFKDSGRGIPVKDIGKIFDPFFTTKRGGSGLGLFSAYSIAKNHGGTITVESQLGQGSTFYVYLPAITESTAAASEVDPSLIHFGSGKVLLMDDNEAIRCMAERMLQTLGYDVSVTKNGEEAIEMYRRAKETKNPFDAVILDLTVQGGKGGKQTLKELQAYDPDVTAIVSSGYSNDLVLSEYQEYGFKGSVSKPYRIQELGNTLSSILKKTSLGTKGLPEGPPRFTG
jgi:signal transduction histidine kinase/ActR/RegA family two-component response regulator